MIFLKRSLLLPLLCFYVSFAFGQTPVAECSSGPDVDSDAEDGILVENVCGVLNSAVTTVSGNIEVKGTGELTINFDIGEVTGSILVEEDATLTINGDLLDINGSITNNGTLTITGQGIAEGKLEVKGEGKTTLDGGSFESTGDGVVIESDAEIELTNGSSITAAGGSSVENEGTITSDNSGNEVNGGVTGGGTVDTNLGDCGTDCSDGGSLPVELTRFAAAAAQQQVEITWSTASEINNDYFLIQKSADGIAFETIGRVRGHGTTAVRQDYTYTDRTVIGFTYYRLKQVDYDGTFEYSNIIWFDGGLTADQVAVGPNPLHRGSAQLTLHGINPDTWTDALLYDQSGKVAFRFKGECSTLVVQLNEAVTDLQKGIYLLRVNDQTKRIILR